MVLPVQMRALVKISGFPPEADQVSVVCFSLLTPDT
jgi:hypothetical protein